MKKNTIKTFRNLTFRLDNATGVEEDTERMEISINNNGNGTCGLDMIEGPEHCRLEGDIPMESVRSLAMALLAFADMNKL